MKFEEAVEFVIYIETGGDPDGGYTDDPRDPGGRTRWGISQSAYPDLDIKNLKKEDAIELYRNDYWLAARCHHLPQGLNLLVFDAAVNNGVRASIKMLQDAVGVVRDGIFGPKTLAAVDGTDLNTLIYQYAYLRWRAYSRSPKWVTYGSGWLKRLLLAALQAAFGSSGSGNPSVNPRIP